MAQTPQVSYLTTDHLGSPRVVTNENGAVTGRKDYSAFGEETISPERVSNLGYTSADELRKGYTGYEKDGESGLDFAQARYYNSTHGRYTSVDPLTASGSIRNPQTFNRYSYVLNSPYKFTDPLGLVAQRGGAWCSTCQTSDGDTGGFAEPTPPPTRQQPAPPPPPPPTIELVTERREYSLTATQVSRQTGVVSQIQFSVTEDTVDVYENGALVESGAIRVNVNATNGPQAQYQLSNDNLNIAATAAAEIIAESVAANVDKTIMLGIAANETFFGTVKSNLQPYMDPKTNPLQLNTGQFTDGTNPIAGDLEHNVRNAIRLYKNDKAPGRTLEGSIRAYGPPPSQDPHYLTDTMGNISEARRGTAAEKISNPFIVRFSNKN